MKKYKILIAVAAPLAMAVVLWRAFGMTHTQTVQTYTVTCRDVEETVRCTGTVETAEEYRVYTDISCKAEQVLAQVGRTVQKGDVLFTVDVAGTVAAVAAGQGKRISEADIRRELLAPEAGVITNVAVAEGKMTDVTRPCVVIASLSQLQLNVGVRESQLRQVRVGQRVYIQGDAFSRKQYRGTLTYLASATETTSTALGKTVVNAVVTLNEGEADDSFRLGLTAKAEVVVNCLYGVTVVPYTCVEQDSDGEEYVYVVRHNRAEKQVIHPVAELQDGYAVQEGLTEGDVLVCDPSCIRHNRQAVEAEGTNV